jgi:hypothetical protein
LATASFDSHLDDLEQTMEHVLNGVDILDATVGDMALAAGRSDIGTRRTESPQRRRSV